MFMNTTDTITKTGILLSNLGTPSEPTTESVREYLSEFLSDSYIVDYPQWLWQPVLHGIILRKRPPKSALLYQKIWTGKGSPLRVYSERITNRLDALLNQGKTEKIPVALGMRYGPPSLAGALNELMAAGANHIILLPLYPQYSYTTTASTVAVTKRAIARAPAPVTLDVIPDYHAHPAYIDALANTIKAQWQTETRGERLLFSFHGTPERVHKRGDVYFDQCQATARLLASKLDLKPDDWFVTFQSQFGPGKWLQPATNKTLEQLARNKVRKVDVVCPGFSTDCLETLEEIAIRNRDFFLASGGERLSYIPCLNDSEEHIKALHTIVSDRLNVNGR